MSKSSPVCECISLKKQIFAYQAERKTQAVTVIRVRMWATSPWGGQVPWHEVFIKMSWQEWDSPLQVGGLEARAAPVSFLSSSASNFFFVAKLLETVEFMLKNYGMLFRCLILILRERFITCNSGSWVGRWPFSSLSGLPFLVWSRISTKSFLYVGKLTTLYPFLGMATKAFHLRILQC